MPIFGSIPQGSAAVVAVIDPNTSSTVQVVGVRAGDGFTLSLDAAPTWMADEDVVSAHGVSIVDPVDATTADVVSAAERLGITAATLVAAFAQPDEPLDTGALVTAGGLTLARNAHGWWIDLTTDCLPCLHRTWTDVLALGAVTEL